MRLSPRRERDHPLLPIEGYEVTSLETWDYNCIAFAADDEDQWWWPDPNGDAYWPPGIDRKVTIEAFVAAYSVLGYAECEDDRPEKGFQKIALYADDKNVPTHAAKLLESGQWASKLGEWEDIQHNTLSGLSGVKYGNVVKFLKRPSAS